MTELNKEMVNAINEKTGIYATSVFDDAEQKAAFDSLTFTKKGDYELVDLGQYEGKTFISHGAVVFDGDKIYTVRQVYKDMNGDLISAGDTLRDVVSGEVSEVEEDENGELVQVTDFPDMPGYTAPLSDTILDTTVIDN